MYATDFDAVFAKIVARAWTDERFKTRLLADPLTVMREFGLAISEEIELRVVEDTAKVAYLVLPLQPQKTSPEENLEDIAMAPRCYILK